MPVTSFLNGHIATTITKNNNLEIDEEIECRNHMHNMQLSDFRPSGKPTDCRMQECQKKNAKFKETGFLKHFLYGGGGGVWDKRGRMGVTLVIVHVTNNTKAALFFYIQIPKR